MNNRKYWQVRKDWFEWCGALSEKELMAKRTGGLGCIISTLYHFVAVEYSWICGGIQEKAVHIPSFEEVSSLRQVRAFSDRCHAEVSPFAYEWNEQLEDRVMIDITDDGEREAHTYGEVMRHVIAHEIHPIGQLSVWAREVGKKPITANLIGRGLFPQPDQHS
ncbi:DinB family protein [Paenibacillus sp. 3LSP]|uniref:DinB family protein n=1 Tax=Paenibacillus sp. 3LSP TaxID=2800795 RepID=UPI0028FD790C|nr:DinB family protein [Paenibacillus sp. 3LSP]MDU0329173.1 DinB family protein [Paenibacillus sp. 3LSP]